MVKVKMPYLKSNDLICFQMQGLKFLIIQYNNEIQDWKTVFLFNFDNTEEIKQSGKRFPNSGLLRSTNTPKSSGFIFLADDTVIGSIRFQND